MKFLVVLLDVFKILLNFVKPSHGVLLPQFGVSELLLKRRVVALELLPALVLLLLVLLG